MNGTGFSPRGAIVGLLSLALLAGSAAGSASAAVLPSPDAGGRLSDGLGELTRKGLRDAPNGAQSRHLGLPARGPGSLLRDGGRIVVEARVEGDAGATADEIRRRGAEIVHVSEEQGVVTAAARPRDLARLATAAGVEAVTEVLTPFVSAADCTGMVTSEGDTGLRAAEARKGFGLDGTGVTVGILSDSFDTDPFALTDASQDVASGDLPGSGNPCGRSRPVTRLSDLVAPGQTIDEGRAMAQIVHDLAPGAGIAFATAFAGLPAFADSVRRLAGPVANGGAGARVIVDDVFYLEEPFFQEGPVGVAAREVEAAGVAYLSSAGNNNLILGGTDAASWEAPKYRDSNGCPAALVLESQKVKEEEEEIEEETGQELPGIGLNASHCLDFNPAPSPPSPPDRRFRFLVAAGASLTIDLQWAEPWGGVASDIDAFLINDNDELVAESAKDNVGTSQKPFEAFGWENTGPLAEEVYLVINRYSGDPEKAPRIKFAILQNGAGGILESEYDESIGEDVVGPAIFGHNGAAGAISVAAVNYADASKPEDYSSRGPVSHYFGPVSSSAPAAPLTVPAVLSKPDLAATDCGMTTFFLPTQVPGINRFCGTSAAAPHAAAVVALMREANPALTISQIRTALAASARPVGAYEPTAVGAGLVDAFGAVGRVALPPRVTIDAAPRPLGNDPQPTVEFSANRPVTFACAIDGTAAKTCSSPYRPPAPLADGPHGFTVVATDVAGRASAVASAGFAIDATPPRTRFRKRPRKVVKTMRKRAKVTFVFAASEGAVSFRCRIDRGRWQICPRRIKRSMKVGKHVVRVQAEDAAGNVDPRGATFRFRIQRERRRVAVRATDTAPERPVRR